jgi:hypothetical protein
VGTASSKSHRSNRRETTTYDISRKVVFQVRLLCRGFLIGFLGLAVSGCVHFPKDYSAQQLQKDATHQPKEALVHYLMQPGADPGVCDTTATRSRLLEVTEESFEAVAEVFTARKTGFDIPARCLKALFQTASIPLSQAGTLLMYDVVVNVLERGEAEASDFQRLQNIANVTLARSISANLPARPRDDVARQMAAALARLSAQDARRPVGQTLLESIDVERGNWRNQIIDSHLIDSMNETSTLWIVAHRLNNAQLALVAQARLVRQRMAGSPLSVVREGGERLVERVLALGHNAFDSTVFSQERLLGNNKPGRLGVRFLQDTRAGQLLARREENALRLDSMLELIVEGWQRPIELCGSKHRFNPEPCVEPASLSLGNPHLSLDADGVLRMRESFTFDELGPLLAEKTMPVPVFFESSPLASIDLPIRFVTPDSIRYKGRDGESGPRLIARVTALGSRTLFEVESGKTTHKAIVENEALAAFRIETIGAQGRDGSSGSNGRSGQKGSDGDDARCPHSGATSGSSGGPGGPGGDGDDGGPGENGGDIFVSLDCGARDCFSLQQAVTAVFVSKGGSGGSGGRGGDGGQGGAGGRGGSGASCGASGRLSAASDGEKGARGVGGNRGADGRGGRPGRVSFEVLTSGDGAPSAAR